MRLIILLILAFPVLAHQYTALDDLVADICTQHSFEKCDDPIIIVPPIDTDFDGVNDDVDLCPNTPPPIVVDATGCEVVVIPPTVGGVDCPTEPTWTNNGRYQWYLCNIEADAELSAYDIDYPMSYLTPKDANFSIVKPSRITVYGHPSQYTGTFVTGASSFDFTNSQKKIEIHVQEDRYRPPGDSVIYGGESWWVFSGNQVGNVKNFNGNRIAASIDLVLERYGDAAGLSRGITLTGSSLGGAMACHQALVLPKYQKNVAIVKSNYGRCMIPKHPGGAATGWGNDHFDEVDIRLQWAKAVDIHWRWSGGENDSLERHDTEFLDICEARKISCSWTWLQSGHGNNETGYSLSSSLWLNDDQDWTLDKVRPVITNNTSNHRGELRGYHNMGVTWNHALITDTPTEVQIPIRYDALVNLGPELPDQPSTVSFSLTLRGIVNLPIAPGDVVVWAFGDQSGTAIVDADGLPTIDGLSLITGSGYEVFSLKKQ